MNFPFLLIEMLTLIGVPTVIVVCANLIMRDARDEKAKRDAGLDKLPHRTRERMYEPLEEVAHPRNQIAAYMAHIGVKRSQEMNARDDESGQWQVVELRDYRQALRAAARRPRREWAQ